VKKLLLATAICVASLTSALGQTYPRRPPDSICQINPITCLDPAAERAKAAAQETQRKIEVERQRRDQEAKRQADFHVYQQASGPLDTLTSDALNDRFNHDMGILRMTPGGGPGDPAVVADLKAVQKVLADRQAAALKQVSEKRDPNDVVAQVLNFTSFGKDQGEPDKFWYKVKDCQYRRYGEKTTTGVDNINLNELDPQSIQIYSDPNGSFVGGTLVKYNEEVLLSNLWNSVSNFDRVERGWTLIYSEYCTGKAKAVLNLNPTRLLPFNQTQAVYKPRNENEQ
jgi:hypothetical protein